MLLVLILGVGWVAVGTEAGARWTLERITPPGARVTGVSGRLLGPLRVDSIAYRLPGGETDVSISELELAWSPKELLSGVAAVRRLSLARLRLVADTSLLAGFQRLPSPEPVLTGLERLLGRPIRPPLPLSLRVDTVRVGRGVLRTPDFPQPVDVGRIELGGSVSRSGADLSRMSVDGPAVTASATGRFRPGAPGPGEIRLDLSAALRVPGRPRSSGRLELKGTTERVAIELETTEPVRSRMHGTVQELSRDAKWAVKWTTGRIRAPGAAGPVSVEEAAASLTAGGTLTTAAATLAGWTRLSGETEMAGYVVARLDGDSLVVDDAEIHRSGRGAALQASGTVAVDAGVPRFSLDGSWRSLAWPLRGDPVAESSEGRFRAGGTPDSILLVTTAGVRSERFGPGRMEAEAVIGRDSVAIRRLALRPAGSPGLIEARATASRMSDPPQLTATARWRDLSWPLGSEAPTLRAPSGQLEVAGAPEALEYRLGASLGTKVVDSARVAASGVYEPEQVTLRELRVDVLGGRVTGSGRAALPFGSWSANLRARELTPDVPGAPPSAGDARLSFRLSASGRRRPGDLTGSVRLDSIVGRARDRTLRGFAQFDLEEDGIFADSLLMELGSARLVASGGVAHQWNLTSTLTIPEMEALHPDLSGTGRADLSVSGARQDPSVTAEIGADSLEVAREDRRVAIDRLRAGGSWRPLGGALPDLEATAEGLHAAGIRIDSLTTRLAGEGGATAVLLRVTAPAGRLVATAEGRLAGDVWTGRIDTLDLESRDLGAWSLLSPVPVRASRDSVDIGRACWMSGRAALCGSGGWTRAGGGRWELNGDSLSVDRLRPWLPPSVDPAGDLAFASAGSIDTAGAVRAMAEVRGRPLSVTAASPTDTIRRTVEDLTLRASVTPDSAAANVDLSLADGGLLAADVRADRIASGLGRLDGRLRVELDDDGMAGAVLPALASTRGRLSGDLEFSGEWPRPSLRGSLALEDARADVVPAGLAVEEISFRLRDAGPGTVRLDGGLRSGPGEMTLDGTARFTDTDAPPAVDLRLQGGDLEVQNTAAVRLLVSPDLRLSGDASGLTATGRVRVPEARVAPRAIEAPVRPSADVVVLDRPGVSPQDTTRGRLPSPPVRVDLEVELGDRVRVEGFGLSGRLAGNVRVSSRPGETPTGRGEIQIIQGRYLAFQRSLRIDQGRLLFSGGPIDDPGLDLRIIRRTAGVEVGMTVGGSARSPRIALFSTPSMSETDLLSYLLFGRPVAGVSRIEGNVLRNAAQGIGLMGGEALAAQLGATLGLEESRLVTEGGRVTALDLGTALSPRLTLGYSLGLFGTPNVFRIEYRLGRVWMIRAESGAGSGADVLYIIER